ncbi:fibulin-7 isoform X1 [Ciona intestinalis]
MGNVNCNVNARKSVLLFVFAAFLVNVQTPVQCQRQATTIVKLKHNIATLKGLLLRQERRLVVGFKGLQRKIVSMNKMAVKAEREMGGPPVTCAPLTAPPNGHMLGVRTDINGATVPINNEVYFVCDDGFHLRGPEVRTCLGNNTWSGHDVLCVDMRAEYRACAKLSCKNGGRCVKVNDDNVYACQCLRGYKGRRCQKVVKTSLTGPIKRAICSNRSTHEGCYCERGYKIGTAQNLCFDVDECSETRRPVTDVIPGNLGSHVKRHAGFRRSLCRHRCVNTPGSYVCTCPPGYDITGDNNQDCHDIDECERGTHNCTDDQYCFNTGGSFQCVGVVCPPHYFRANTYTCHRDRCRDWDRKCLKDPLSYTFSFIDIPANLNYPVDIFRWGVGVDEGATQNNRFYVTPATNPGRIFSARKVDAVTGMLVLNRPLDVSSATVDFEMREFNPGHGRQLIVKYTSRIIIFSSPYAF